MPGPEELERMRHKKRGPIEQIPGNDVLKRLREIERERKPPAGMPPPSLEIPDQPTHHEVLL